VMSDELLGVTSSFDRSAKAANDLSDFSCLTRYSSLITHYQNQALRLN
jgi:hypothetical protein